MTVPGLGSDGHSATVARWLYCRLMRVIVGSPAYPLPPNDGAKVRWTALLRELGSLVEMHGVFGLMPRREVRDPAFERHFNSIEIVPTPYLEVALRAGLMQLRGWPSSFGRRATPAWRRRVVRAVSQETGAGVLLLGTSAGFIPALGQAALLDLVDVHSRLRTPAGDRSTGRAIETAERTLVERYDVLLSSESDRRWLVGHGADPNRLHVVPNGVNDQFLRVALAPTAPTLLFVGNLRYRPNEEALRWFIRSCWPGVQASEARPVLRVVGYGAERLGRSSGTEVYPSVPDMLPHYAAATVAIAPLRAARGTQLKVLEAMAAGLPVVCTSPVAEGLFDDHPALVCDEAEAFTEACRSLLRDAGARRELGDRGRDYVRRHHDWSSIARMVRDVLQGLLETRAPYRPRTQGTRL